MTFYIDSSVIVPLFVEDRFTAAATGWLSEHDDRLTTGRLATAEVSSALSRLSRMGLMEEQQRLAALQASDEWFATSSTIVEHLPSDLIRATMLVRHPSPKLLSPDAIHLATASRLGLTFVTFDTVLAEVAAMREIACVRPDG